ncbi:MAG: diaminopimelate decarboxylase [Gemmatimonadota bacterium]|nr:diaminopimelate decarboxylase [Gemmatimonadota bacterium]
MGTRLLTEQPHLLQRIAAEAGTPVYVYDAGTIRNQYSALRQALRDIRHRLFYSVKANSNLAILELIRKLGAGADIVSVGELERVLEAGYHPDTVVFSGVGKTPNELARALDAGVGLLKIESAAELEMVSELARRKKIRADVGIRVNPDVSADTHPYTRTGEEGMKFGVRRDEVVDVARWTLAVPEVRLVSIGMHIGSQILDADHYRNGARTLARLVGELRTVGCDSLKTVNVGGGMGIRYTSEHALSPDDFVAAVRPLADETGLELAVEPGRYLVGAAGLLLTTCLYRKRMGEKDFVIVDAGMNDLLRPSLYDAVHDIVVIGRATASATPAIVDVVGPVCESGDFLGLGRQLTGVEPGSLLAIVGAGAYGFTMASSYNSRPRPPEVLVDDGRWAVIRDRETVRDLMRGERSLTEVENAGAWIQ